MNRAVLIGVSLVLVSAIAFGAYTALRPSKSPLILIGENTANTEAIELEIRAQNLETEVQIIALPFEDAFVKINQDMVQRDGSYDVVMQYNFSLSPFIANEYVYSLTELEELAGRSAAPEFEGDLYPRAWREVGFYRLPRSHRVEKVGYPFATNTMVMVYRRDLFENPEERLAFRERYGSELRPPATWEEYHRVVQWFTRPQERLSGVVLEGAEGGWLYYELMNFLYGQGGGVYRKTYGWEDGTAESLTIDSPQARNALNFFLSLRPYNAGDFYSVGQFQKRDILRRGGAAVAFVWSDTIHSLIRRSDGSIDPRFGFAPVPGDKSMLAGGAFFVTRGSQHSRQAYDLILRLMNHEAQVRMTLNGLSSPFRSVYSDERVKRLPHADAMAKSLDRGVYMLEAGPDAEFINQVITREVQRAWRGDQTAEAALTNVQREILRNRSAIGLD